MRILVIEDNEKLAHSLKRAIEQEGYAVDCINDGLAGEKRMEVNHKDYDLLILDLMLPGKDGIEICKSLRKEGIMTPILMLTAKDTVKDKVLGLDSGADDYLVKPFALEELLSRVRALSRRPKEALSPDRRHTLGRTRSI
jgi:OmpR-family two-component system manganese-sensing response regulator